MSMIDFDPCYKENDTSEKRVIITVGVSGSGKTTFATNFIREKSKIGQDWVNINRDDIRSTIFTQKTQKTNFKWSEWNKKWEKEATALWKSVIEKIVKLGTDGIIISDTNLNPKIRLWLEDFFTEAGYIIEYKFFPIDFDKAVKQDLQRSNPVGSFVIAEQLEKFWSQFHSRYVPDKSLPKAVIVDVDGTLAHMNGRGPFDWDKVDTDIADEIVVDVVEGLKDKGYKIIIFSGRDGCCKDKTYNWLLNNLSFEPDEFHIRAEGDTRRDTVVKEEMFWEHIAHKYNVVLAIDDRPQVVMNCWNALGIKTLSCGNQSIHF